jgi:rhodanese-related sulfurtransferase
VSIPLRSQFATWLGWLLPPDVPIVVVRNHGQNPADILWPALNIGYTAIAGELTGGVAVWTGGLATTRVVGPSAVDTPAVVDVRQSSEHADGHLPGARLIELGNLLRMAAELPDEATTVMCGHGERAATAASLLERAGRRDLSILAGGPRDWAQATGRTLDTGR